MAKRLPEVNLIGESSITMEWMRFWAEKKGSVVLCEQQNTLW